METHLLLKLENQYVVGRFKNREVILTYLEDRRRQYSRISISSSLEIKDNSATLITVGERKTVKNYEWSEVESDRDETIYKGYKTLAKDLTSFNADLNNERIVQYRLNEWIQPNEGMYPLFVFAALDDLRDFLSVFPSSEFAVYECEYKKSKFLVPEPVSVIGIKTLFTFQWPKGTEFADEVKLTKKIKNIWEL